MAVIDIQRHSPFSLTIFELRLPGFFERQARLVNYFLELRSSQVGVSRSNCGGWHSTGDLQQSTDTAVKWLVKALYQTACLCLVQQQTTSEHHQFLMHSCWANINDYGDWNAPHAHQPWAWAGVCYIDVCPATGENCTRGRDGELLFVNPLPIGAQYQQPPTVSYRPSAGKVFIFPGFLTHMVAPHFADTPRISVSFNLGLAPINQIEKKSNTQ